MPENSGPEALIEAVADGRVLNAAEHAVVSAFYRGDEATPGKETLIDADVLRLACIHSRLTAGSQPVQLAIANARISGALDLEGLRIDFPLSLRRCELADVKLNNARLVSLDLAGSVCRRLDGAGLHVAHGLDMTESFEATGRVRLPSASIGGDLNCSGSHLRGEPGWAALLFDGARIDGRVFLRRGKVGGRVHEFVADRGVVGRSARVGGGISCYRGRFARELELDRARIGGDLRMLSATVEGKLGLAGARIDGNLDLTRATLGCSKVDFARARIQGSLTWKDVRRLDAAPATFEVDLTQAHAGYLVDEDKDSEDHPVGAEESWCGATVVLDGFTFDGIAVTGEKIDAGVFSVRHWAEEGEWLARPRRGLTGGLVSLIPHFLRKRLFEPDDSWVGRRRRWLASQPTKRWTPHPYDQVRAALRSAGHEAAARTVAVERERQRRIRGRLGWGRPRNWLFGVLLGYGYRPIYAVLWSLAFVVLGWLWFDDKLGHDIEREPAKAIVPHFSPVGYALDAFLPINLGQVDANILPETPDNVMLWVLTAAGWLLTALLVAALTGLLRKD